MPEGDERIISGYEIQGLLEGNRKTQEKFRTNLFLNAVSEIVVEMSLT